MTNHTYGIPLEGFATFSKTAATEGIVLLKNELNTLPITKEDNVALFGRCQIDYYRSGTGSGGAVNVAYSVNALDGLKNNTTITLNEQLVRTYEQFVVENPFDDGGGGWAAEPWFQKEMPLTDELVKQVRKTSNKAVVIIGRTAGEDKDNADTLGSYRLTHEEESMLLIVTQYFEQVALVFNVSNVVDVSFTLDKKYQNRFTAILFSWQGGIEGGNALADVLSGHVTPSGKLSMSIAKEISDYPSDKNFGGLTQNIYEEDIYLGYRYFETFNKDAVLYPFGFGLSYTTFNISVLSSSFENMTTTVNVLVTNTGMYDGKEVVQLYYRAPQGLLGKPAIELGALAKTKTLLPGESEHLTLTLRANDMASYDDSGVTGHKSSYVLEAGSYDILIGNSIRNNELITNNDLPLIDFETLVVVESLSEALAPVESFNRLKPGCKLDNGLYASAYEPTPLQTEDIAQRIVDNLPTTLEFSGDLGYKLHDVAAGDVSLETFVSQLNDEELATLVRGEGMSSPKVTPGTAGAFGGVSDALLHYGIKIACAADGPSGIRMDSGHLATQIPIGTLLACTFNVELIEELYTMLGRELVSNHVDTLLGPGINIHRHPLNGRNFEYFSEDPYLTGVMAAACTRGLLAGGSTGTLKHFACNDQEMARTQSNSIVSERALRELHLKPFEIAVKQGKASSIMTAYNPINGIWAASNYDLNTTILRGEWNYDGIVMTDWWAKMNHPISGGQDSQAFVGHMVRAQNDLFMVVSDALAEVKTEQNPIVRIVAGLDLDTVSLEPLKEKLLAIKELSFLEYNHLAGLINDSSDEDLRQFLKSKRDSKDHVLESLKNGDLTRGELQRCAMNICNFIMNALVFTREQTNSQTLNVTPLQTKPTHFVHSIQDLIEINASTDHTIFIEVPHSSSYELSATLSNKFDNLAQASFNIECNETYIRNIQLNGTNGEHVTKQLLQLHLEQGYYEFTFKFTKPGITIKDLTFTDLSK